MIINLKNIFSKKIILSIIITSIFWLIILLGINLYKNKSETTLKTKNNIIPTSTPTSPAKDGMTKIYEKGDISLYESKPNTSYVASISLKKANKNDYQTIRNNVFFYGNDTEICNTDNSNIIVYNASFGDMGAHDSDRIYINTNDSEKNIEIKSGNGIGVDNNILIYDKINSPFNSTIQVSLNDQCGNQSVKKAWVKDLMINGYPQNIFPKEYEIECINDGELGDLVSLDYTGINKTLDKIFLEYKTSKIGDTKSEVKLYSYDLINHKIKAEEPSNLLESSDCKYPEN